MITTTHGPAALLDDPAFAEIKANVIESTGHFYYADKSEDLARRIGRRMAEVGAADWASYGNVLHDFQRGAAEWEALIHEITIGESYFFRHPEHFEGLRAVVFPELIARNRGKRLRIWCAGCADGAEPYSLSILIRRKMPQLAGRVSITATDINRRALATANAGKFDEWSFRAIPGDVAHACFLQEGKKRVIAPLYREGISFQPHNLALDAFPPGPDGAPPDLIICRNVMIYFNAELVRTVVQRFHECLAPGGWLLVGPSEPNLTCFNSFETVNIPGATLYRKSGDAADPNVNVSIAAPVPMPCIWDAGLSPRLPQPPSFEWCQPKADPPKRELRNAELLGELRDHTAAENWEKAARCCEQLGQADPLNAVVYLHRALVLEQRGESAAAEKSLRQALYLDRRLAPAHYHLGLLFSGRGERRRAGQCFANTLASLAGRAGDEAVPDSGAATVEQLRRSAQALLEASLGQAEGNR